MFFTKKKKTFAGQRRRAGLLNHRLLLTGAVVAVVSLTLLSQFGESGMASWWKLRSEQKSLQKEVTELDASNQVLENKLDALAEDPRALEKIAREQHNMRREEEEVLTVLDRTDQQDVDLK